MPRSASNPWRLPIAALLLAACNAGKAPHDSDLEPGPVDTPSADTSPSDTSCVDTSCVDTSCVETSRPDTSPPDTCSPIDTADTGSIPDEVCDGLDNDGDRLVDEGWVDSDGNGVPDCLEGECVLAPLPEGDVDAEADCAPILVPPLDPWDIERVWETAGGVPCAYEAAIADFNHDGTSDLLCRTEAMALYDGVDGSMSWKVTDLSPGTEVMAVADVEGDGSLDIFALTYDMNPIRLSEAGDTVWVNTSFSLYAHLLEPLAMDLADLDADGVPEVVTNQVVLSAVDGSPLFGIASGELRSNFQVALSVIGSAELGGPWILSRDQGWSATGTLLWDLGIYEDSSNLISPVPVQADSDPEPEIVYTHLEAVSAIEVDGSQIWEVSRDEDLFTWALSCSGDVDGDGEMELVFTDAYSVNAWNLDGEEEWTFPILDLTTTFVACSTFDFDLDGAREVLVSDPDWFYIVDGHDGSLLYKDPGMLSLTAGDMPMVVDLDGDGSVEIVLTAPMGAGGPAARVYRNVNRDWPPGGRTWGVRDWSGTSRNTDMTVPRTPEAPWLAERIWRGQPDAVIPGSDLRPEVTGACTSSCDGADLHVAFRVVNQGPEELRDGTTVAIYKAGSDGSWTLLGAVPLPEFVDNGHASASHDLLVPLEDARRGLRFVAGDDGSGTVAGPDCDPSNDTLDWVQDVCP